MEELNNSAKTTKTTGWIAIASFLLGIVSLILGWTVVIGIVCGVISIILGIIALAKKNKAIFPVLGMAMSLIGIIIAIAVLIVIPMLNKNVTQQLSDGIAKIESTINEELYNSVVGKSWESKNNSLLILNTDGTFKYYKDKEDLTNYYYEGTYKLHIKEDAVQYIANDLADYGVTEQEEKDIFEKNKKYSVDNYLCLVLTNEKCIIDGENTIKETVVTPYFGFYYDSPRALDIANMATGTYVYFTIAK